MIALRRSHDRGLAKPRWLDGRHTFSFGDYYDGNQFDAGDGAPISDEGILEIAALNEAEILLCDLA